MKFTLGLKERKILKSFELGGGGGELVSLEELTLYVKLMALIIKLLLQK